MGITVQEIYVVGLTSTCLLQKFLEVGTDISWLSGVECLLKGNCSSQSQFVQYWSSWVFWTIFTISIAIDGFSFWSENTFICRVLSWLLSIELDDKFLSGLVQDEFVPLHSRTEVTCGSLDDRFMTFFLQCFSNFFERSKCQIPLIFILRHILPINDGLSPDSIQSLTNISDNLPINIQNFTVILSISKQFDISSRSTAPWKSQLMNIHQTV